MPYQEDGWREMVSAELLADIAFFKVLSPRTQRFVAERAKCVTFDTGSDLFRQGDPPTGFFALQNGRVKLCRQSRERCQILALPMPGECIGAESLPTGTLSPYSAIALKSTTAIYLPPDDLLSLLDEHPDLQEVFLKLITDRLKQFVTLVHDLAFRDVASRLAMVLLSRAQTEGERTDDGICFERLLSQQEFAAMVGTAREVISRSFHKMKADGLIRLSSQQICVLDLERLSMLAAQEIH